MSDSKKRALAPPSSSSGGVGGGGGGGAGDVSALTILTGEQKRARYNELAIVEPETAIIEAKGVARTSSLMAPIVKLEGHKDAVHTLKFSPDGEILASGSKDKSVLLWKVYGDCANFNVLEGHKNAVLDVSWAQDSETLFTASADKTVGYWDILSGKRLKRYTAHGSYVHSVAAVRRGPQLAASGGDDRTVRVWDIRQKAPAHTLEHKYPITAVEFSIDGSQVFSGGIDNDVSIWDIRKGCVVEVMEGHTDTVSSLSLSPAGTHLLSFAMDGVVRTWDVRPFVPGGVRADKALMGAMPSAEKSLIKGAWSPNGERIACGSGDGMSFVWGYDSGALQYRLPGHSGACTQVDFHPKEPIIGSASIDKTMFLGEISRV